MNCEQENPSEIADAVRMILEAIGEDPEREGLKDTPVRVQRMYQELCAGYAMDLDAVVNGAIFSESSGGLVLIRDISFYSLCEHHMLPFFGKVHVGYIPDGKVIGLSKIPRIVEMYARRLQIQERMTQQIADAILEIVHPRGIAVTICGSHMCSIMRGVRKEEAELVTHSFSGLLETDPQLRTEFLEQTVLRVNSRA